MPEARKRARLAAVLAAVLALSAAAPMAAPAPPAATAPLAPGELRVAVTGLHDRQGWLSVLVFDRAEGFPHDAEQAAHRQRCRLSDAPAAATLVFHFTDLAPGRYAVVALHDANGNRRLDTGLFGKPREPIGASNNPAMRFGPPRFDRAAFTLPAEGAAIDIALRGF
ncbi:MAG: DUF2141 domain-containing protein [Lentisphaerae bacterium]|nr:DUF2141 domain-containing protein [Lentisphaerota bacterium]